MRPKIHNVAVQIVRFVDDNQPGLVECEFIDAEGRKHSMIDKVPIFAADFLDRNSTYPCLGAIRCEVLDESQDIHGRELVRISTAWPDDVESTEGLVEFVILSNQLSG